MVDGAPPWWMAHRAGPCEHHDGTDRGMKRAMIRLLLVASGGALGAVARYGVGRLAARLHPTAEWPWGTLTANVIGGLLMGLLAGWLASREGPQAEALRLFAAVGVLGGFTTFSAFSLETALLLERRQFALAGAYVGLSVLLAIAALFVGLIVARRGLGL